MKKDCIFEKGVVCNHNYGGDCPVNSKSESKNFCNQYTKILKGVFQGYSPKMLLEVIKNSLDLIRTR